MNNNIYISQKDSGCGRTVENEKRFNTNDNNNNGDDFMKNTTKKDIKVLGKKQFKALSKGQAYKEYESVGELANNLKIKADEALEFFKSAKQDALRAEAMLIDANCMLTDVETELADTKTQLDKSETELADTKTQLDKSETELADTKTQLDKSETELADTKTQLDKSETELADTKTQLDKSETELADTKTQLEETELKLAEANGKIDAGFDLTTEIQNDLDELIEERDEGMKTYNRLGARMTGKINRANINAGTIRHYKNIINQCKKDIETGKDVEGNKATINELEAEIRNLQRQVEAAKCTFHEMKHNKTIVSQRIDSMDDELNKRYKLNNLLGELGYI